MVARYMALLRMEVLRMVRFQEETSILRMFRVV